MNPLLLCAVYFCVTLAPLALSWAGAVPPRSFWDEIASGAGMLAFSIILVEFVLSGRFQSVSRRIGMDVTMRLHQLLARTALALALVHPFLYRAPFRPQVPWDETRQLSLTTDLWALAGGMIAWALLFSLVLLSIFRDRLGYRHEVWRLLHGLGAALIGGMLLHHTLEAGRYAQAPALAWFWAALFAAALVSLAWVYLVKPLHQLGRPWTVRSVSSVGARTWELTLAPDGHDGFAYEAGQFAWINLGHSPFSLYENPFSISSAPSSGAELQFIIKELGDFTSTLGRIEPGSRAYVDGPFGHLTISGREAPGVAFFAGGVGVAPLIGVWREMALARDPRPVFFAYGNRVEEQIVHRDELEALAAGAANRLALALSDPPAGWTGETGVFDPAAVRRLVTPEMTGWLFILCGPNVMMESVEDALIDLGVPPARILSERFKYD